MDARVDRNSDSDNSDLIPRLYQAANLLDSLKERKFS